MRRKCGSFPFLMQGVTTAFIGNDGDGGPEVSKVLARTAAKPTGSNYAAYAGFGAIREKGDRRCRQAADGGRARADEAADRDRDVRGRASS